MDPNVTLGEIRTASREVLRVMTDTPVYDLTDDDITHLATFATVLAQNAQALDSWLIHGGFKPAEWQH